MPAVVTMGPKTGFQPSADQKSAWAAVRKRGEFQCDAVTAQENLRNSGGMLEIKAEAVNPADSAPSGPSLADMSTREINLLFLQCGGKTPTGKTMKKAEKIAFISKVLDAMDVADDDMVADGEGSSSESA